MKFETYFAETYSAKTPATKTPATLDEIRMRVACALERHPLCRDVQFDIVRHAPHQQSKLDH